MTVRPRNFPANVAAAIFDFDETMIDLERQHAAASTRLCDARGERFDDLPEKIRTASGRRIVDEIADLRAFFHWTDDPIDLLAERQRYFDEEIDRSPDLALMRGVERTIRALHARGARLAIASSAVGRSIDLILRRVGLRDLFETIVDGSAVKNPKPDPEAYVLTAERLGVDARRCVVFEDSAIGVRAAKAAAMYCVAVRHARAHQWQDLSPADLIVSSFEEIDVDWFPTSWPR